MGSGGTTPLNRRKSVAIVAFNRVLPGMKTDICESAPSSISVKAPATAGWPRPFPPREDGGGVRWKTTD